GAGWNGGFRCDRARIIRPKRSLCLRCRRRGVSKSSIEIRYQRLAVYWTGVNRSIDVVPARVVVVDRDRVIVPQIALDSEVHLLGVRILEIPRRGEAERLTQQRKTSAEILLIHEDRVRIQRVEPLLVWQVLQASG